MLRVIGVVPGGWEKTIHHSRGNTGVRQSQYRRADEMGFKSVIMEDWLAKY